MKIKTLGLFALAAATLFVFIFMIVLALHWPFSQSNIQQSVQSTFPGSVTFHSFHTTYFPHPGFTADNLVFNQASVSASTPPLVTIAHFTIETHYLDLLLRPGYLARITLNDFRLHIPVDPHNLLSSRSASSNTRIGEIIADGSSIEIDRDDSAPPLIFDIHTLRLSSIGANSPLSYTTTLHIPLPPGEVRAKGKFGPWNSNEPGQTPLSGEYNFQNADLAAFKGIAGTLSSDDHFQGVLGHIEARGTVDVPNFTVTRSHHPIHLQSAFHAFIDGTNGDVQLDHADASYLKTRISAKGEVAHHSGPDGKVASVDLFVSNGRIQDVLFLFVRQPEAPLLGITSFRAHIVIPPEKRPFLQKIRIIGDFGIQDGQFAKASSQESIDTLSERARGEKTEQASEAEKVITDLAGHVDLRNATANLSDLRFHVPGASAHMSGTYNLESTKIDLHGTLKTDEEFSNMTTGIKSILLKPFDSIFRKKHAGAVIPVHLVGTFDDPQPGLDFPTRSSDLSDPH